MVLTASVALYALNIRAADRALQRRSSRVRFLIQGLVAYRQDHRGDPTAEQAINELAAAQFIPSDFLSQARADMRCPSSIEPYLVIVADGLRYGSTHTATEPAVCENPDAVAPNGGFVGFNDNRVEFVAADTLRNVAKRAAR